MQKVAFVLLVDYRVHNFMRSLVVKFNAKHHTQFSASVFPPHVTLKQPFAVSDRKGVEAYLDALARSVAPFEIALHRLEFTEGESPDGEQQGILWLAAAENPTLRALHRRINVELAGRFENTAAPFDGPDYRFHATLEVSEDLATMRRIYDEYRGLEVDLMFTAREMMMAYCPNEGVAPFISYKIAPLGTHSGAVEGG